MGSQSPENPETEAMGTRGVGEVPDGAQVMWMGWDGIEDTLVNSRVWAAGAGERG